jgi:hypothetical protein
MAHLEGRREIHGRCLLLDRGGDLRMAVAGVDAPQAGGAVENAATVIRGVIHAGSGGEQARLGLVLAVCRERHPEMRSVQGIGHVLFFPFGEIVGMNVILSLIKTFPAYRKPSR